MASNFSINLQGASKRRGADLFVEVLQSEGGCHVFGNPVTTEIPLLDTLADIAGIDYVLGLHEASVVSRADGYAQASGRPEVATSTPPAGWGNAIGAMLNAKIANTPHGRPAGYTSRRGGAAASPRSHRHRSPQ